MVRLVGMYWNTLLFQQLQLGQVQQSVGRSRSCIGFLGSPSTCISVVGARLSVCKESVNFSLENSESLLEFRTISRWLLRIVLDDIQYSTVEVGLDLVPVLVGTVALSYQNGLLRFSH